MKILLFFVLLCFAPSISQANESTTNQSNKVIIVLDASGSMWGQINAEPKIGIAKSVVRDLVKDWDSSIELGLTAYGHRRKGDCSDIEALVPVSHVDVNKINGVLEKINPRGKTPLSRAVRKAAEELRYTENKATVILVSDGIETCDFDPCKVAAELEKSGVDFTTHVVGFDVHEKEAKQQLTCLAENTGGRFMAAHDAASLKSSLREAVKEVAKKEQPNLRLVAVHEAGGEPLADVSWQVFSSVDPKNMVAYGRGATPQYSLKPGKYIAQVTALNGKAKASKEFEIPSEDLLEQEVILAPEGILKLIAVNEEGGEALDRVHWSVHTIADENGNSQNIAYGRGAQPEYQLLPGKYLARVESTDGPAKAEREIEVIAGEKSTFEVLLALEGVLKLVAVNQEGGEALDNIHWSVHTIADELGKSKNVAYGRGAQPEYRLLPGKYLAKAKSVHGPAQAEQEVEVTAGKENVFEVVLAQEGIIKLIAVNEEGGNALDRIHWSVHTLPDERGNSTHVVYGKGAQPEYRLLPGKYLAKAKSTHGPAEVEQEIEVIAGKKITAEVVIEAEGMLELVAVHKAGGKALDGVHWKLFTIANNGMGKAELVTYGKGTTPTYQLLPGKYLAKVNSTKGMATAEQEVEVHALKKNRVEVIFPEEGEVELSAVTASGASPERVYWEVFTLVEPDSIEKPQRVKTGGGKTPRYLMLPGRYMARATFKNQKFTSEFEVKAGKITREEVRLSEAG